jgi:hypothetical protein
MNTPPPLPSRLRELLARHGPEAVASVERSLPTILRPCLWVESERVGRAPLHRSRLARMLGGTTDSPRLPLLGSTWGGMPYTTAALPLRAGQRFLGQINFAELPPCVPEFPRQGLLAIDLNPPGSDRVFQTRWYARPSEAEATTTADVRCVGRFEAALRFHCGWSVSRGEECEAVLPFSDEELLDAWSAWEPDGSFNDDRRHRLGGYRSLDLDALSAFQPPPGRSEDVREYELLLRLTFDNAADFAWGTNWTYLLIHRDDLRDGHFDRMGLALGNA